MNNELEICRKILLSSGPGEFDTIVSNLKVITSNGGTCQLSDDFINHVRATYNKDHNVINEEDVTTSEDEQPSSSMIENIEKKVDNHLSKNFNASEVNTKHKVSENSAHNFIVEVNCNRVRLDNCHSGSFTATYHLDLNNYIIKGNAKIFCHYFEDGNVQLFADMHFKPITIVQSDSDPSSLNAIFKQISKWENEIISKLQSMFEDINENILKSVRRVLPISKTKFEWNANLHRMVKCLERPK